MSNNIDNKRMEQEYLWNYFQLHATQRITLFRFYLIIFSLFFSASGFLLIKFNQGNILIYSSAIILSLSFIFITRQFCCLDMRNRNLIKMSEKSLVDFEKNFSQDSLKIFNAELNDHISNPEIKTHTMCFKNTFYTGYTIALIFLITTLIKLLLNI